MNTPKSFPIMIKRDGGFTLIIALFSLALFFTLATAYLNTVIGSAQTGRHNIENAQAFALAEGGVDKAISQLDQNDDYRGEENTRLSPGAFTITISVIDSSSREVTVTGFVPNNINSTATRTVKVLVKQISEKKKTDPTTYWMFVPGSYVILR